MAIGEDADEEELGGARMHARTSGLCDYLARDEADACASPAGSCPICTGAASAPARPGRADAPLYPAEELLGIAPVDVRVPFDVREILARVVDGSRFEEFKAAYGAQLVCGWASLGGYPIGVVANNGILFSEEAQKGAQFIELCNRSDTPILFVQNITGFMVGTRYEQGGIIKDGAKLINAVSNSTVPHLTLMVGASYGAGNYAMAGRAYDPRFVFTWPNHRIAVMGPKQLAGVLSIVRRNAAEAAGRPFDERADEELRRRRKPDRGGVDRPVRHGPPVGRRHHRSARHADGAGHRADRRALRPGAGHGGLRRRAALMAPADPHASWWPTGARSPGGSSGARTTRGSRPWPCTRPRTRRPARRRGRPRPPSGGPDPGRDLPRPGAPGRRGGRAGADALHPGYGFLSENPALPEACAARASPGWARRPSRCG